MKASAREAEQARRRAAKPEQDLRSTGVNHAVGPTKGRKAARCRVYLSADDVARLADEAGQHRAFVLTLAYTGIRWGEAIALRVRDVEFLRRRLSLSQNAVQLGVDHAVGPTKGRKARSVPVPAFVIDELSAQCVGKIPVIWCSQAPAAPICRDPSRRADGSPRRSARRRSSRSRRTIYDTRARACRCRPG